MNREKSKGFAIFAFAIIGVVLAVFMIFIATYRIMQYGATFPKPVMSGRQLSRTTDAGGIINSMSGFIWDYRSFDMIMQTPVLLATAIGCTAMLRVIRRKR